MCGNDFWDGISTEGAQTRIDIYEELLTYFNAPADADTACASQEAPLPFFGAGNEDSYWAADWDADGPACTLVNWVTEHSLYDIDDYKRCVCHHFGAGADDCPQATDDGGDETAIQFCTWE